MKRIIERTEGGSYVVRREDGSYLDRYYSDNVAWCGMVTRSFWTRRGARRAARRDMLRAQAEAHMARQAGDVEVVTL